MVAISVWLLERNGKPVSELAQCLRNNTEAQQYIVESLKRELELEIQDAFRNATINDSAVEVLTKNRALQLSSKIEELKTAFDASNNKKN